MLGERQAGFQVREGSLTDVSKEVVNAGCRAMRDSRLIAFAPSSKRWGFLGSRLTVQPHGGLF